jgi:hypothetical protein
MHMPPWAEDPFHGDRFKSVNNFMPEVAKNTQNVEQFAIHDRYLRDPSLPNLISVLQAARTHTGTDGLQDPGDVGRAFALPDKHFSVLWASHLFRMQLKQPSVPIFNTANRSFFRDFHPLARAANEKVKEGRVATNSFMRIGAAFRIHNGANPVPGLAPVVREKLTPDIKDGQTFFNSIGHFWTVLGQLFDQPLAISERTAGHNATEVTYWNAFQTGGHTYHRVYLNFHRNLMQLHAKNPDGGFGWAMYAQGAQNREVPLSLTEGWLSDYKNVMGYNFEGSLPHAPELANLVYNYMMTTTLLATEDAKRAKKADKTGPYPGDKGEAALREKYDYRGLANSMKGQLAAVPSKDTRNALRVTEADFDALIKAIEANISAIDACQHVRSGYGPD